LDLLSPEVDVAGADTLVVAFFMSPAFVAEDSSEPPLPTPWIPLDGATAYFEAAFTSLLFVVF